MRFWLSGMGVFLLLSTSGCGLGLCIGGCIGQAAASVVSPLHLDPQWEALNASWQSAAGSYGYLLVRHPDSEVHWDPVDGEVYSAGQAVGSTHLVVYSGSWTTAADTALTNGATYHYQVFSYNGAYQYTAGATASGVPGITCPTNYLAVGPNADVGVVEAFCVAKYEMKDDGSSNAVSQMAGLPWASISRDDNGGTPGTITRCRNIGPGFDLISNAQWQAVAREIETAESAGVQLNWSNGSTAGANGINHGHSDFAPFGLLAASTDGDPCFGTGNANCANNAHAHFTQKRTHVLSSGETIWDIAGNAWESVKGDIAAGPPFEGVSGYISQQPWTSGLNHPEMWGPFGSYVSKNSGEYGGLGYGWLGISGGVIIRGGGYATAIPVGVFQVDLGLGPLTTDPTTGFRCAYN